MATYLDNTCTFCGGPQLGVHYHEGHRTNDGVQITIGMRVFGYDWCYGTVDDNARNRAEIQKAHEPHEVSGTCEAWFDVTFDQPTASGMRGNSYDCSRMWSRDPQEGRKSMLDEIRSM